MRLGVISDIHADFAALTTALDLLVKQGVDKIVCLGDVAEKGLNGDACAQVLQNWLIPCVRGNHDELATVNQADAGDDPRWQQLHAATLAYLRALPLSRYDLYAGCRVLMCHGSPDDVWEYLHPDMASAKRFKQVAKQSDADVILCGHSHMPMQVTYGGVQFFNPGSICGAHTTGSRTYGILDLPQMTFQIFDLPPDSDDAAT